MEKAWSKGILLLGTEMEEHDIKPFTRCGLPVVLIDNYFEALNLDCVTINNLQGAYLATDYLIKQTHAQPGYLHSAYSITGFEERADGFYKAIRKTVCQPRAQSYITSPLQLTVLTAI